MNYISVKLQEYDIPPQGGKAFRVERGQLIKIIDVRGGQGADFFAFNRSNMKEYLSAEHTRPAIGRLFPRVGQPFYTQKRRPIITFVDDHSPGIHDMLFASCNQSRYNLELGYEGWHPSCEDNLMTGMKEIGVPEVEMPQPVNFFANFPLSPDGELSAKPSATKAGDFVLVRVEIGCYCAVSACPQDLTEYSGTPTEIRIEVGT